MNIKGARQSKNIVDKRTPIRGSIPRNDPIMNPNQRLSYTNPRSVDPSNPEAPNLIPARKKPQRTPRK